ncbi:MAG TPA: hypothetical protein VGC10_09875 [Sphingomonas sp.]
MYDFVDRPVARISYGGRFVLWAMRGWIRSATIGSCPPGALAPAFARHAALPALPHFHRLLCALNTSAVGRITLAPLNHNCVTEDEAILLQLWRDATEAPPTARATLALLLRPEAVGDAFTALLSGTARLGEVGLGEIAAETDGVRG